MVRPAEAQEGLLWGAGLGDWQSIILVRQVRCRGGIRRSEMIVIFSILLSMWRLITRTDDTDIKYRQKGFPNQLKTNLKLSQNFPGNCSSEENFSWKTSSYSRSNISKYIFVFPAVCGYDHLPVGDMLQPSPSVRECCLCTRTLPPQLLAGCFRDSSDYIWYCTAYILRPQPPHLGG